MNDPVIPPRRRHELVQAADAIDAALTRECERIHAAWQAGDITRAECAGMTEAAHRDRDAKVRQAREGGQS